MRNSALGRHARPSSPSRWSYLIAALAALAALIAALVFAAQSGQPAQAQVTAPRAPMLDRAAENAVADTAVASLGQDKTLAARAALTAARARAAVAAATYTVRAGDSLSAVAARRCGQPRDWTGIYAASRARHWTAGNANVLTAGQHLFVSCAYLPSMLRYAPAPPPPPRPVYRAVSAVSGPSGSYHRASSGSSGNVSTSSYNSSSGTYSYAGLERLWISAGGPSWAAAHAAEIAECESGGRTSAYNPSGATGLWQILGSVVPGNLYNAFTNALNAVAKFRASGGTFAQWVCR